MERPRLIVVGTKALLFDKGLGNELFRKFFGKPFASKKPKPEQEYEPPFVLSLYEALYLCEKGEVSIEIEGSEASCEDLRRYAESIVPKFRERYAVYKDLRDRGYIVRSGMKFGADFAVYEIGPGYEHAPYLVLVLDSSSMLDPISIVRLGRLSHSVRKHSVLAIVDRDRGRIDYLVFKWVRM